MAEPIFDDAFLDSLPLDTTEAVNQMASRFAERFSKDQRRIANYDIYVEAAGVFDSFQAAVGASAPAPKLDGPNAQNLETLTNWFGYLRQVTGTELAQRRTRNALERGRERFAMRSGALFYYEFPEQDVAEIQQLLNRLRELIFEAEHLTENHKARLLRRLEQLQTELHKKMSDLDRFWGLLGDAGVAIRKFGEDTKRVAAVLAIIGKIAHIVWKAQLSAHQLPPDAPHPMLPPQVEQSQRQPIEV